MHEALGNKFYSYKDVFNRSRFKGFYLFFFLIQRLINNMKVEILVIHAAESEKDGKKIPKVLHIILVS